LLFGRTLNQATDRRALQSEMTRDFDLAVAVMAYGFRDPLFEFTLG